MSRSTLALTGIVCAGFAMASFAQTRDVAQPAAGPPAEVRDLATTVKALEERVARVERRLAARQDQEELGRGLVSFEPFVANLRTENLTRYIRVSLVFAVEDGQEQSAHDALADINPRVKDWLYGHFADKSITGVMGRASQDKLRSEIQAGVNSLFHAAGHPEFVKAVLFDEINVQ